MSHCVFEQDIFAFISTTPPPPISPNSAQAHDDSPNRTDNHHHNNNNNNNNSNNDDEQQQHQLVLEHGCESEEPQSAADDDALEIDIPSSHCQVQSQSQPQVEKSGNTNSSNSTCPVCDQSMQSTSLTKHINKKHTQRISLINKNKLTKIGYSKCLYCPLYYTEHSRHVSIRHPGHAQDGQGQQHNNNKMVHAESLNTDKTLSAMGRTRNSSKQNEQISACTYNDYYNNSSHATAASVDLSPSSLVTAVANIDYISLHNYVSGRGEFEGGHELGQIDATQFKLVYNIATKLVNRLATDSVKRARSIVNTEQQKLKYFNAKTGTKMYYYLEKAYPVEFDELNKIGLINYLIMALDVMIRTCINEELPEGIMVVQTKVDDDNSTSKVVEYANQHRDSSSSSSSRQNLCNTTHLVDVAEKGVKHGAQHRHDNNTQSVNYDDDDDDNVGSKVDIGIDNKNSQCHSDQCGKPGTRHRQHVDGDTQYVTVQDDTHDDDGIKVGIDSDINNTHCDKDKGCYNDVGRHEEGNKPYSSPKSKIIKGKTKKNIVAEPAGSTLVQTKIPWPCSKLPPNKTLSKQTFIGSKSPQGTIINNNNSEHIDTGANTSTDGIIKPTNIEAMTPDDILDTMSKMLSDPTKMTDTLVLVQTMFKAVYSLLQNVQQIHKTTLPIPGPGLRDTSSINKPVSKPTVTGLASNHVVVDLTEHQWHVKDIAGDGRCFFACVGQVLNKTVKQVKQLIVSLIDKHPTLYQSVRFDKDAKNSESYCKQLVEDKYHGGSTEMLLLSHHDSTKHIKWVAISTDMKGNMTGKQSYYSHDKTTHTVYLHHNYFKGNIIGHKDPYHFDLVMCDDGNNNIFGLIQEQSLEQHKKNSKMATQACLDQDAKYASPNPPTASSGKVHHSASAKQQKKTKQSSKFTVPGDSAPKVAATSTTTKTPDIGFDHRRPHVRDDKRTTSTDAPIPAPVPVSTSAYMVNGREESSNAEPDWTQVKPNRRGYGHTKAAYRNRTAASPSNISITMDEDIPINQDGTPKYAVVIFAVGLDRTPNQIVDAAKAVGIHLAFRYAKAFGLKIRHNYILVCKTKQNVDDIFYNAPALYKRLQWSVAPYKSRAQLALEKQKQAGQVLIDQATGQARLYGYSAVTYVCPPPSNSWQYSHRQKSSQQPSPPSSSSPPPPPPPPQQQQQQQQH
jgi:hypothetical protein